MQSRWLPLQVALMFLTRGPMPLEPVWREFFSSAALVEPLPEVQQSSAYRCMVAVSWKPTSLDQGQHVPFCHHTAHRKALLALMQAGQAGDLARTTGSAQSEAAWRLNRRRRRGSIGVIAAQQLFSVYLHPSPGQAYPNSSIFAGHEVGDRVRVQWAQWSVVSVATLSEITNDTAS